MHDWELAGGLDPHAEPEPDDDRFLCGCGDPRCWLLGNDASNVNVNGTWYAGDCTGLCYFCGEVDDLRHLARISGSWLAHEGCAAKSPVIVAGLEREARIDEAK